jgi:hypothetical protein
MQTRVPRTKHGRRLRNALSCVVLTIAMFVLGTGTARADFEGTRVWNSACTGDWTADGSSAYARVGQHYKATTHRGNSVTLNFAHATLDSYDCGPHGYHVAAGHMWLVVYIDFYGSNLNCDVSFGVPAGVSFTCHNTAVHEHWEFNKDCGRSPSCEIQVNNITHFGDGNTRYKDVAYMLCHIRLDSARGSYQANTDRF